MTPRPQPYCRTPRCNNGAELPDRVCEDCRHGLTPDRRIRSYWDIPAYVSVEDAFAVLRSLTKALKEAK